MTSHRAASSCLLCDTLACPLAQVEQDLVCSSGSTNSLQAAYEAVADLINDARLTDDDRRVVL